MNIAIKIIFHVFMTMLILCPMSLLSGEQLIDDLRTYQFSGAGIKILKGEYYPNIEAVTPTQAAHFALDSTCYAESQLLAASVKTMRDNGFKIDFLSELYLLINTTVKTSNSHQVVKVIASIGNPIKINRLFYPIVVFLKTLHPIHDPVFSYHLFFDADHNPRKDMMDRLFLFLTYNIARSLQHGLILSGSSEDKDEFWRRTDSDVDIMVCVFANEPSTSRKQSWLRLRRLPYSIVSTISEGENNPMALRDTASELAIQTMSINHPSMQFGNDVQRDFQECMEKINRRLEGNT